MKERFRFRTQHPPNFMGCVSSIVASINEAPPVDTDSLVAQTSDGFLVPALSKGSEPIMVLTTGGSISTSFITMQPLATRTIKTNGDAVAKVSMNDTAGKTDFSATVTDMSGNALAVCKHARNYKAPQPEYLVEASTEAQMDQYGNLVAVGDPLYRDLSNIDLEHKCDARSSAFPPGDAKIRPAVV